MTFHIRISALTHVKTDLFFDLGFSKKNLSVLKNTAARGPLHDG